MEASIGMDKTNGTDYSSRLPSIEAASTQPQEQKRRNRKRKNTSESHQNAESDTVQRSAKQRRSSLSNRTSPEAVASTSRTTTDLPHATTSTASALQPAVGLSMPSISSSSSLGSNSNPALGGDYTSDTPGSSECLTHDFDYHQLDSPATISSNVMSPLDGDGLSEWPISNGYFLTDSSWLRRKYEAYVAVPDTMCYVTASHKQRSCPMPRLSWADTVEVWNLMSRKDELAWIDRNPDMFDKHPGLQPRMRSILLDWLNEVCEVYKLHRETYYLAVDYIDRYLHIKVGLKKTHLQLLGITSLFIAAKVEEIYPPKIGEFAYVTDGACTDEDILREELLVLSTLDWKINPVTVMGWLGLYMQINVTSRKSGQVLPVRDERSINSTTISPSRKRKITDENEDSNNVKRPMLQKPSTHTVTSNTATTTTTTATATATTTKTDDAFVYPQFSGMEFAHTAQLIDLCSLDVGMANFKYSVIAAAAISHTFDRKTATFVSGYKWEEIAPCAKWMEPFFQVICDENAVSPLTFLESNDPIKYCHGLKHVCPNLVTDSSHIIQTHTTSLEMLDLVNIKIEQMEAEARMGLLEASPAPVGIIEPEEGGILTPPSSNRKSLETVGGGGVFQTAVSVVPPSDKMVNVLKVKDVAVTATGTWSTY